MCSTADNGRVIVYPALTSPDKFPAQGTQSAQGYISPHSSLHPIPRPDRGRSMGSILVNTFSAHRQALHSTMLSTVPSSCSILPSLRRLASAPGTWSVSPRTHAAARRARRTFATHAEVCATRVSRETA